MNSLRPVTITPTKGKPFKGFFHKWGRNHIRLGEHEQETDTAIIEREDGTVTVVEVGEHATIQFNDRNKPKPISQANKELRES